MGHRRSAEHSTEHACSEIIIYTRAKNFGGLSKYLRHGQRDIGARLGLYHTQMTQYKLVHTIRAADKKNYVMEKAYTQNSFDPFQTVRNSVQLIIDSKIAADANFTETAVSG